MALFLLLQFWRPCYFLTDDNLAASLPLWTESGREIKAWQAPNTSAYLFGGNYNYLRDLDAFQLHPFILGPALLADTPARFWIVDLSALLHLLLATAGFTALAYSLREELSLKIPDAYIVFYTLSFIFSAYTLTVGSSWVNFLGNLSALPWLTLGILDRKVLRGIFLIMFFTIHEILGGYAPLSVSTGLCLTLFAIGAAWWRRSGLPLFCWYVGNVLALLVLSPLLLAILDGFAHSDRVLGFPLSEMTRFAIPARTFPFSFFLGNWSEPFAYWQGDKFLASLSYPYLSSILACAAAWCLIPALIVPVKWHPLEKLCALVAGAIVVFVVRPEWLAVLMYHMPFFKSMRWPFREGILFLFFVHLFLILRFPERPGKWQPAVTLFSLMMFLLPLPFIRVPTLNTFFLDRQLLFSGEADRFWAGVKTQFKPTDEIATVIDFPYLQANSADIPYTLLGTADYPTFFQVRCISGYSPTAPTDQLPMKTLPGWWFGAFLPSQVDQILAEKHDLKVLRIESTHPLKITMSSGSGPEIDLTPYLQSAKGKGLGSDPTPRSGH